MARKRSYSKGADRGNKLSPDNPRGFKGTTYGAPKGKARRIDPRTVGHIDPPKLPPPGYLTYFNWMRANDRKPLSPEAWKRWQMRKAAQRKLLQPTLSAAVRKHQRAPYQPL